MGESTVLITDLNKADVLAILYNTARPQGMGFMQYDPKPMTREDAKELLKETKYFDYLRGRVMKINVDGDVLYTSGYEMDNGSGVVKKIIDELRKTGDVNPKVARVIHIKGHLEASAELV